ncbi:ROK family transcriptional regulator [Actinacidiphila paucisporea]|uniref:Sugar kinase of the NBD/HSP70 family, may contain an N-terminal HTH domain n=1 Tax=Actinacidiphila paucisporea TaxID=310782 RepID=A0A1M7GRC8_9ACTN|nr:ROK family transcriptional regulator [Actinacidiphila paucisporea]SHM18934.1 Sugar kinase of the NBD/HSP70 family, may contain an N-terminal HTH domain [Actinacidiphila paucisporea]
MTLAGRPPAAALVFRTLLVQGPLTRAELGRRTGLSPGAVTKVAAPLLADGWITELGRPAGERASGRPATPMAVRAERARFIGVKVTADELIGVLTDLTATPLATRRAPLASRDVDSVVRAIARLVTRLRTAGGAAKDGAAKGSTAEHGAESPGGVHGIGVTLAGDIDARAGTVQYSPFLDWRQVPLARLAGAATGTPTVVDNDVRALTVAEQWFGAGAGLSSFALVTVGAGIGCGIAVDGRVVSGAYGVAGEAGHLPVGGDRVCTCGNTGCVEAVAATHAITEQARQATGDPGMTMAAAVRRAHAGDPAVREVFARAGRALGLAMASIANLVGPQRIVISGEGVASYDLFADAVRAAFRAQAFGAAAECDLVVRPLPFEAWARGGAAVAAQQVFAP